jgi:acyl carrier protein
VLHDATKSDRPCIVLFSSLASVTGAPGQALYAAANAFLDAFASWRSAQGYPTLTVGWGPWSEPGMAQRAGFDRFRQAGLHPMPAEAALDALHAVDIDRDPHVLIASIHRPAFLRSHDARVRALLPGSDEGQRVEQRARGFLREELAGVLEVYRRRILTGHVVEAVAGALGVPPSEVSEGRSFVDVGIDSLTTAELRSALEHALDVPIDVSTFFDHDTPAAFARAVLTDVFPPVEPHGDGAGASEPPDDDEDIAAELRARLEED